MTKVTGMRPSIVKAIPITNITVCACQCDPQKIAAIVQERLNQVATEAHRRKSF